MIRVENVSKSYGPARVLSDVTLDLPKGGITSLIGPNGAGKSTLLSLIARLIPPNTGRITVDGMDVARAPSADLARRLAILRQENHLVARLTVRELVGFGRFPHSAGRLTPADHAAIDRALDYLDLQPLASRFIDQLSGGQRQRAFVAMVLAQDTDYLLLDEPLNNLDMSHARALMQQLSALVRQSGKSVVVVVHEVNYAAAWADHVVALKEGRVAATGTPAQVLTSETLSTLYDTDVEVTQHRGRPLVLHH